MKTSPNFSGYTLMDGMGKVAVLVRDGYLSTGYSRVNECLPSLIRCYGEGPKRQWVYGALSFPIPELDGMFPNQVVQHYRKLAKEKELAASKAAEATAPTAPTAQFGLFAAAA